MLYRLVLKVEEVIHVQLFIYAKILVAPLHFGQKLLWRVDETKLTQRNFHCKYFIGILEDNPSFPFLDAE